MRIGVIDIGSNTIKLLVAARSTRGGIDTVHYAVEEARIGRGIGSDRPALTEESMQRGVAAVATLVERARTFNPVQIVLVATSAVREATNGQDFARRIHRETGLAVRILTGTEEADAIGRGLATDPALAGARNFYLFDLGGGSLECLEFRERRAAQSASLRLGCVRLTERCVTDPAAPFTATDRSAVAAAVLHEFAAEASSGFHFTLPSPAAAVATGGTVTTVRAMLAASAGHPLSEASPTVNTAELEHLLDLSAALPLAERRQLPGLPAARADVFPTALTTMLEVARLAGVEKFTHSYHNLRYGIAAEQLGL
jgi:exopolyphosphatase/guanosine-5'-triphosphate,3'-diphosphate pyrophosphatase